MRIVKATMGHAVSLAPRLRAIDKQEVKECIGLAPKAGLIHCLNASVTAHAVLQGPRVFALYGCAPSPKDALTGVPWMLGSDEMVSHHRDLIRVTEGTFASMLKLFPRLENYVSVENYAARRWLLWAGFDMVEHVQHYGEARRPYIRFVKEVAPCAQ